MTTDEPSALRFEAFRQSLPTRLGSGDWITLYEISETDHGQTAYYCALTKLDSVAECLKRPSWDVHIGDSGVAVSSGGDDWTYERTWDSEGLEPLVFKRMFNGPRPSYLEVSEAFRHYFQLYEDKASGNLIALDDNGDDVLVVRMAPKKVEVRAKYIKEYLGVRRAALLLFFEHDAWSPRTLEELDLEEEHEEQRTDTYCYSRWMEAWSYSSGERNIYARILGKKVVYGPKGFRLAMPWENRTYEDFIIGVDDDGNEVRYTSDEEQLANYFGKNRGAPHYLTPVFFRKTVMNKYYADPARYEVEDGHVFCKGSWSLRLDNNHQDYVIVFLGDLGKLAPAEQLYWKSFNVAPDGAVSDVQWRRGFLGEWADAEEPALAFKAAYRQFRENWRKHFGWDLFKPLRDEDAHHFGALHVPANGNQKEFDEQVMALSKLMVERLNESEIAKHITVDDGDKGITKFGKYIDGIGFPGQSLITFLRNLNGLRTGPAHVKGSDYRKAAKHFDVEQRGFEAAFAAMLTEATALLNHLAAFVLPSDAAVSSEQPE